MEVRDQYDLGKKLGKGAFASVYLAKDKTSGKSVAVKRVRLDKPNADVETCQKEVLALTRIHSPYITEIFGAYVTGKQLWIVMESMDGGSVDALIKSFGSIPDDAIGRILYCSSSGLAYMHQRGQVHRDIKPDNILLTVDGVAKLCDLGVSYDILNETSSASPADLDTDGADRIGDDPREWLPRTKRTASTQQREIDLENFVGTPFYMAPEVIDQMENTPLSDVWSLGIAAIEMATGKCPRSQFHPMKAMLLTRQEDPPSISGKANAKLMSFIEGCLQKDPSKRLSAESLSAHKFTKAYAKKAPKKLLEVIGVYLDKTKEQYSSGSEDEEDEEFNGGVGIDHKTEPWDF